MTEQNKNRRIAPCFIIAEAGVNHNGRIDLALQLVDAAKDAGVDAVKFQTFIAEEEISKFAPKAEYQKEATTAEESQLEMVKKLELDEGEHERLLQRCRDRGIQFLSSPFDLHSIRLLERLGVEQYKIPSGEITNLPYLRVIGHCGKPVLLSTGMATLGEIEVALSVLEESGVPQNQVTVLHCNTEYPTPMEDVNLRAMCSISTAFEVPVGYSDHTIGSEIAIAAVALGACVIEKHLTLDRTLPGPDHAASVEPCELAALVQAIRNVEIGMGCGVKRPSPSESKNIVIARKSIVAACEIKAGKLLSVNNLTTKRPGGGLSPMQWDQVVGTLANRDYQEDEMVEL